MPPDRQKTERNEHRHDSGNGHAVSGPEQRDIGAEGGGRELFRLPAAEHSHGHDAARPLTALSRWAQPVVLCGMALLFVWLLASGNINNYINTRFVAYTCIGAAALLALAGYAVLMATGRGGTSQSHTHATWAAAGLVAVPLIFGAIAPSQPLGASAVTDDSNVAALARVDGSSINTGNTQSWNILDWLQAFHTIDDQASLNGRPADVTGFVRRADGEPAGQFRVSRFLVSCCVADTISIGMPVQSADGAAPAEGDWARVTGTVAVTDVNGETQPLISNATFTVLPEAPKPPYLYP
jgi:uncharacterized repeat protein (TIGR03943 family)